MELDNNAQPLTMDDLNALSNVKTRKMMKQLENKIANTDPATLLELFQQQQLKILKLEKNKDVEFSIMIMQENNGLKANRDILELKISKLEKENKGLKDAIVVE